MYRRWVRKGFFLTNVIVFLVCKGGLLFGGEPVQVSAKGPVVIELQLKPGWKFNPKAPSQWALYQLDSSGKSFPVYEWDQKQIQNLQLFLPLLKLGSRYQIKGKFYFCSKSQRSTCGISHHDLFIEASYSKDALNKIRVEMIQSH
jgi:hypothetical protein